MPDQAFYATREDLLEYFNLVEGKGWALQYVQLGVYLTDNVPVYLSGAAIPDLGLAESGEKVANRSFMVCRQSKPFSPKRVPQRKGGVWYFAEATDEESIILQPGGLYRKTYLIEGEVVTNYKTDGARRLYRHFVDAMKGQFRRVGRLYVGKGAGDPNRDLFLTYSVDSPGPPRVRFDKIA